MRINVYAEEMTDRVEIVSKDVGGQIFTGLRFYLELPASEEVTHNGEHCGYVQHRGPFMHRPGDDDSSAVTFWSMQRGDLLAFLRKSLEALDAHNAMLASRSDTGMEGE